MRARRRGGGLGAELGFPIAAERNQRKPGRPSSKCAAYIEHMATIRFDPLDNPEASALPNRAGWRKGEGEAREWLIPPERGSLRYARASTARP